eukprot:m.119241 g.119241  ORF g.119241 m.119241 type:complete len:121 (+) comp9545_c0_seq2:23-385(+)
MSTVKAMRELQRSWSEENLFQIQTREKIEKLEAELAAERVTTASLRARVEEKESETTGLRDEMKKLRIKLYDASKGLEQAEAKIEKLNVCCASLDVCMSEQRKPAASALAVAFLTLCLAE